MNSIEKLTELFSKFPGIGARQAQRFAHFLMRQSPSFRAQLIAEITNINTNVTRCNLCLRYVMRTNGDTLCPICADASRSKEQLMVVEKETDVESMERSGAYRGLYFVFGGTMALSGAKRTLSDKELLARIQKDTAITEVILALSATVEGEYTADELKDTLAALAPKRTLTISTLGRGLSTGSELEYADEATLKNAIENRR